MANVKISQLEKTTDMSTDAYVLVVQNGKNYKMSIKDAIAANIDISEIDLSNYYTKNETIAVVDNAIEDFEIVTENGATTIIDVANTVEIQTEQILQIENTIKNINENAASEDDAEAAFDNIFEV